VAPFEAATWTVRIHISVIQQADFACAEAVLPYVNNLDWARSMTIDCVIRSRGVTSEIRPFKIWRAAKTVNL